MSKIIRKIYFKGQHYPLAEGEAFARIFNEAEIHKRALADPDAQPLTTKELAQFKRVNRLLPKN